MDRNDLHVGEDNNLRWQFGAQPDEVHVRASGICLYDYDWNTDEYYPLYWTVVDDKGDVYLNNVSELGGLFDFPVNKIDGVYVRNQIGLRSYNDRMNLMPIPMAEVNNCPLITQNPGY